MRSAETVLAVIHERGKQGLPLEDIYRQLYNPDLYLRAYARLYSNDGAMTRGITTETVDAMSMRKIEKIIDDLRHERYRWTPVRRVYVPKKNGKLRPLGVTSWSDKLVQEVMRLILEAFYEPQFSKHSHGFRPMRGCHTALSEITTQWTGVKWYIEGDISNCFGSLDHQVMMSILKEKLHDNRFLRLIQNLLQAGYLEEWRYHTTLSGCPQGGVISPILSNIYMDKLDRFVEQILLPEYNRKQARQINRRYNAISSLTSYHRRARHYDKAEQLSKELRQLPYGDPNDPEFRRLGYVRYADDTLLGFAGPKADAEEIKRRLAEFLRDTLHLELSQEKTLITHATTQAARFLGYEIVAQHADDKIARDGRRAVNGKIGLRVPADVVEKRCAFYMRKGKPSHRIDLLQDDDFTIIDRYQSEYRGLVQYYLLAQNVCWFDKLHWVMQVSLLKTLANKHKTTRKAMLRKYKALVETPYGPLKCLELVIAREGKKPLVARFGGIPLRRQERAVLIDQPAYTPRVKERNELIKRLLANKCELCGSTEDVEVHHIRKLADLNIKGRREKPLWVQRMAQRRRKTLAVCGYCHTAIHAGRPTRKPVQGTITGEPDESKFTSGSVGGR